jgi:hypothetical protein
MNYTEINTVLEKSMDAMSDSDLRSLNQMLVREINHRIAQTRLSIKRTLTKGARVTINDPRCTGKFYQIEKLNAKTAVLVEEDSDYKHPIYGTPIAKRIRASITMLQNV